IKPYEFLAYKIPNKIYTKYIEYTFTRTYNRILSQPRSIISDNAVEIFTSTEKIERWTNLPHNSVSKPIMNIPKWEENPTNIALKYYTGYSNYKINQVVVNLDSYTFNKAIYQNKEIFLDCVEKYNLIKKEIITRTLNESVLAIHWKHLRNINSYLGVNLSELKAGKKYKYIGFISTSLNLSYKEDYDGNDKRTPAGHILFFLEIPKGTHCIYPSKDISNREEYELIVNLDQYILIEKIHHRTLGSAIIKGKIVSS
ncbi:MAG: ADP-ribosyltransferase, partial [Tannerellaceae bacterium]|nr:ADP-ribosyltransferase [Tannerellaceae bacterium]